MDLSRVSKAIAAVVVVTIGEALTFGQVPDKYQGWAQVIIAVAAYFGVYAAPKNSEPPLPPPRG